MTSRRFISAQVATVLILLSFTSESASLQTAPADRIIFTLSNRSAEYRNAFFRTIFEMIFLTVTPVTILSRVQSDLNGDMDSSTLASLLMSSLSSLNLLSHISLCCSFVFMRTPTYSLALLKIEQ